MNSAPETPVKFKPIGWRRALIFVLVAVACFHAVYFPANSGPLAPLLIGYVACLTQLARLRTTRLCFNVGLALGFACFAPQLDCFWRIFGAAAIALWLVLAFWIAIFVVLTHLALARLGPKGAALLIPFLWTGLEYFRSELYYLRFSWLNPGYAFAESTLLPWTYLGMYGVGFMIAAIAAYPLIARRTKSRLTVIELIVIIAIVVIFTALLFPTVASIRKSMYPKPDFVAAGVQLEFPSNQEIMKALDKALIVPKPNSFPLRGATNVNLVVLPEYTLDGEPPKELLDWCKINEKFLVVGGKQPAPGNNYYNTAFVISTNGEVVFKQGKSVPIQFFKDGLPATEQKLWASPWGKIGICICYDLSYTRVTDELVRQGAQMIIVPTMDVADWGRHQHELHARVAPTRAAEYGVPIFRVASSGISQGVNRSGRVIATAPFPGDGETIYFGAALPTAGGTRPLDRWLAPICVGVTGVFVLWLGLARLRDFFNRKKSPIT